MVVEQKDINWLKSMVERVTNKDIEHNDTRGPISEMRISGPLVTIEVSWLASYQESGWVRCGDEEIFQFLTPKVELLDKKMIRLTSTNDYCIIFFGFDCIMPVVPARN